MRKEQAQMKRLSLITVTVAALMTGCNNSTDTEVDPTAASNASESKASEHAGTTDEARRSTGVGSAGASAGVTSAPAAYEEVKRDGHIYVVASKTSADKVRSGQKLSPAVTAFGFGPSGERVYFESDKEGRLDQALMAEFTRRHPKQ
jgi:hypothetical protein